LLDPQGEGHALLHTSDFQKKNLRKSAFVCGSSVHQGISRVAAERRRLASPAGFARVVAAIQCSEAAMRAV